VFEASSLDGASGWQTFRHVTFPMLRPVSTVTLLLGLIYTLKVFDIIWIMTRGGPANTSTTLATWSYELGFGNMLPRFGPSAAVGNVLILVAVVAGLLYVRVQRHQEPA
jgi:multiple sugar transport system permease protein